MMRSGIYADASFRVVVLINLGSEALRAWLGSGYSSRRTSPDVDSSYQFHRIAAPAPISCTVHYDVTENVPFPVVSKLMKSKWFPKPADA